MNKGKLILGYIFLGLGIFFLLDSGLGLTSLSKFIIELYSVPLLFVLSLFLIHSAEKQIQAGSSSDGKIRLPLFWSAASIVILVSAVFVYILVAIAGAFANIH